LLKSLVTRKKIALFLVIIICLSSLGIYNLSAAPSTMRNISSLELVKDMKLGWNLGNTLDAIGGETAWGNPKTTEDMILKVKSAGFNTIRIPVTWKEHVGSAPNYTIEKAWLDRVQEVVDYAIDNNMYAILNTHHEGEWLIPDKAHQTEVTNKLSKMWEQIATRFKDYSDYLIFETMNEPRVENSSSEWSGGTSEFRDVINQLNKAAVSSIRNTGGNNASRFLMIPTHAATAQSVAVNDLIIPDNDPKIIVSLHTYSPYSFCLDEGGTNAWGTDSDKANMESELDAIYNKFVKNGRAVIIGEWASINKNNLTDRVKHAEYYTREVVERGMLPVWWDNGYTGTNGLAILNRSSNTWLFPEIVDALIKGLSSGTKTTVPSQSTAPTAPATTSLPQTTQPTSSVVTTSPVKVSPTQSATNSGSFAIDYSTNDWGSGAVVNITITNNSTTAKKGWTLTWTYSGNQKITNIWGGEYTQSGSTITVKNSSWNSEIPPNGYVSFGFSISYSGTNAKPTDFKIN